MYTQGSAEISGVYYFEWSMNGLCNLYHSLFFLYLANAFAEMNDKYLVESFCSTKSNFFLFYFIHITLKYVTANIKI